MDQDFENFLNTRGLSLETKKQYTLYFEKIDVLYKNRLLSQEVLNEFLTTYKSSLIKSFLKLYLEYRGITNLTIPRRTGRRERKQPVIMSEPDRKLLFKVLYSYNWRIGLMAELSYCCALRRNEVCNIEVQDIDWEDWLIKRETGKLLIKKGKGGKERFVIVPKYLMERIKNYVNKSEVRMTDKLFYKDKHHKTEPISKERYWTVYHDTVKELFGKKYKLHTLRYSKATEWFNDGMDIVRIQQRLGHSNISTTRLYINPDEKKELENWRNEEEKHT